MQLAGHKCSSAAANSRSVAAPRHSTVLRVASNDAPATSKSSPSPAAKQPVIHIIPNNGRDAGRAINGIPPVMGAHLMASGTVSPISVSKGPGLDVTPHPFQYPLAEGDSSILLHFSKTGVAQSIVKAVAEAAEAAIAARQAFTLVLSGGSLIGLLSALADKKAGITNWDKWHIFYVDERNVPHNSPDSNHKGCMDSFLSKVPIPASNLHAILENVPVDQAAKHYEGLLIGLPTTVLPRTPDNQWPVFDMTLLGIGPDGHVASLFPNKAQTAATSGWVLPVTNSPKPPPERITMTMPVINHSKDIIVVAMGEGKAEVVQRILEVQALPGALPAQLVRPANGRLRWFLDVQSAQHLDITNWEDKKAFPRSQ